MTAEDTEAMIADALEVEIEAWWQSADLPSACYLSARIGYLAGRSASRQREERLEGALEETTLSLAVIAEMPLAEQDDMHAVNMRAVAKRGLTHARRARAALEDK